MSYQYLSASMGSPMEKCKRVQIPSFYHVWFKLFQEEQYFCHSQLFHLAPDPVLVYGNKTKHFCAIYKLHDTLATVENYH